MEKETNKKRTWNLFSPTIIALSICLGFVTLSIIQATYFRTDLRRAMLKSGRRVAYLEVDKESNIKKKWLYDGHKLFDLDKKTALAIPFSKPQGTVEIELALTHFFAKKAKPFPIPRKPAFINIYNGACTSCPIEKFRKKSRVKKVKLEIWMRELRFPIIDFIKTNEVKIWEKVYYFPDRPTPNKIDISKLSYLNISNEAPHKIAIVILRIQIQEIYAGLEKPETKFVYLEGIQYVDQDTKGNLHYWE